MPISSERASELNAKIRTGSQPKTEGVKPKVPTPAKESTKLSNWDANIAPILDAHPELKETINFKSALPMMRAYNGRYDQVMKQIKENGDDKAYDLLQKFKNNSAAMANELKKYGTSNFNPDAELKYRKNAMAYFDDLQHLYAEGQKKGFVMTDKAQLLNSKQYEKYKQEPEVTDEASVTARVIREGINKIVADYETGNVSKAYQKLKGQDEYFRTKGIELMAPITKSYVQTSLARIGQPNTDSKTNADAFNLNSDILKHISKHKTTLDPELARSDQNKATSILNQLKGKTQAQQYEILRNNAKAINGMTGRMGYYGNAKVIDQYRKSSIGTDIDFYPTSNDTKKTADYYFNLVQENGVIDNHRRAFRDFKEADKTVRIDALKNIQLKWKDVRDGLNLGGDLNKNDMDIAFQSLVDANGNIRSFDAWQKQLTNKLTSTTVLKDQFGYEQKFTDNTTGVVKFYNKIKGMTDPDYFVSDYYTRGGTYSQSASDQKEFRQNMAKDRERQASANAKQRQVWIEAYSKLKKAYKKDFDNVKVKNVYDATLMDIGFGDERNQALAYKGVNLSVNKDMKLKETTGPKQENINKVFNLMFDAKGAVDTEKITLFSGAQIKSGLNAVQKDDLKLQKTNNEKVLKDFLAGDKNDHVTVTFLRNTNVPGQAAYKFYNTETKKSMMLFAPTSMLGNNGIKEDLYTKTGRDPIEFTFNLRGGLTMPVLRNDKGQQAYKSAELKYDKETGQYYGETMIYNSIGKITPVRTIISPAGQVSLSAAQRMYLNILKDQRNSF